MAHETRITIVGNLVDDPELRFTPNGDAVANFTVASTSRKFNRETNEWEDDKTLFQRGSVWRKAAENAAESLQRGNRVIVVGDLTQRGYEDSDGNKRTVYELDNCEIATSLQFATATIAKNTADTQASPVKQAPAKKAPSNTRARRN